MKAWIIKGENIDGGCADIVYAETRGKAKAIALKYSDQFEGFEYTDLKAKRFKEFDQYYKGVEYPDVWYDKELKVILVRDYFWHCHYTDEYCDDCPAREYCDLWEEDDFAF